MSEGTPPLLRLESVTRDYIRHAFFKIRRQSVLREIHFTLQAAEVVALVGRSGAGKSTLARILSLMERPSSGRVEYAGRQVEAGRLDPATRREIQYVFQSPASSLNPRMRIWHQLREAPLYHRLGEPEAIDARLQEILKWLGLEGVDVSRFPHEFSGGQQQRLALARALSVEPRILVCDEVTSSLDPRSAEEVLALLRAIRERFGVAIVMVSHDLPRMQRFADRVLVLRDGALQPYALPLKASGPALIAECAAHAVAR